MRTTLLIIAITFAILSIIIIYSKTSFSNTKQTQNTSQKNENLNKIKIIAFGDSLTEGLGTPKEYSYPSQLKLFLKEQNIDVEVINSGISGETTHLGLSRAEFIANQNGRIVLLGLGANDMLRAIDPKITKGNLSRIISILQAKNVTVILLGMKSSEAYDEKYKKSFNEIYPDLAKEFNIPLVPLMLEGVALNPKLNNPDQIHPNKDGYKIIVENNIAPMLTPIIKKIQEGK